MLVAAGKGRFIYVAALAFIFFIAIVTWNYNPSITDDTLKAFSQADRSPVGPGFLNQKSTDTQETLPFAQDPDLESKLPSKNPVNPYAADSAADSSAGDILAGKPATEKPPADGTNAQGGDLLAGKPATDGTAQEKVTTGSSSSAQKGSDGKVIPPRPEDVDWDRRINGKMRENEGEGAWQPFPSAPMPRGEYHEVVSQRSKSGNYFHVNFPGHEAINPNILPHPRDNDTWVIIAQDFPRLRDFNSGWCAEIACDAKFDAGGNLTCITPPQFLTIPPTSSPGHCVGELANLNLNIGPHDARVFYGPNYPYIIYGSQSHYTCFGLWVQDFRLTYDWGLFWSTSDPFSFQTEIQRPPPLGPVEKNYFFFWDDNQDLYAHYDTAPHRAFAKINQLDGSAGPDLAPQTREHDEACWKKHLAMNPLPTEGRSSIHQATNSLSLTFCNRTDPGCHANPGNTYIIQIYQHKAGNGMMHARYEPYVMVFKKSAPFAMHAISAQPIWIRGRSSKDAMIYCTSIGWKDREQTYSGYLDDVLFLNFGVEDRRTASIDITAKDLLGELMAC